MSYSKPEKYTYGYLFAYLHRAYQFNAQGGGWRSVGAGAPRADYYPQGLDGAGAEIVLSWHGQNLMSLTTDVVEIYPLKYLSKPMLKFINRVLRDAAPGHELTMGKFISLTYNDRDIYPGFYEGMYFTDSGRFIEVNGRTVANYTKEDN